MKKTRTVARAYSHFNKIYDHCEILMLQSQHKADTLQQPLNRCRHAAIRRGEQVIHLNGNMIETEQQGKHFQAETPQPNRYFMKAACKKLASGSMRPCRICLV